MQTQPVRDVILRDGRTMRLRVPTQADAEQVLGFVERLSDRSLYYRFHGHPAVVPGLVAPFLSPDGVDRGSLVGTLVEGGEERVVALASWERLRDPAVAEAAFAVEDALQGVGVGTRLVEQLAESAGRAGDRAVRRRSHGREPADAPGVRRRGLRRRPGARGRYRRGEVPDRLDGRLPRGGRPARSRRRRCVSPAVLPSRGCCGDRCIGAFGIDRGNALPERGRGRVHRSRRSGEPLGGFCRGHSGSAVGAGDRDADRPCRHLPSGCRPCSTRWRRCSPPGSGRFA